MSSKELESLLPIRQYSTKDKILNNEILVTGGAGFLGIHILKDLVLSKKYKKIYTIVRNKEKLKVQAEYFNLGIEWIKEIEIIQGDLLNLKELEFPNVEKVIHSAAQIHCIKTLKQLWNNNVETTEKVSQIYKNNEVFFISTLSVFVSSNLIGNHEPKSLETSNDYFLYGGYAQSKFIGEKIIEKYNQNIIRLGLITGSSKDGIFPKDFFSNFVNINKEIKIYPEGFEESLVDMTPVDFCSKIICKSLEENLKIKHIANKDGTKLSDFIKILKLNKVTKEVWQSEIETKNTLDSYLLKFAFFKQETLTNNFNYFNLDLFQTTNHTYNIKENFEKDNQYLLQLYCSKI